MRNIKYLFFIILFFHSLFSMARGGMELPSTEMVDREQQQLEWCFQYSNRLGYTIAYINNPRLFQNISEWINVPYQYSGKTKDGVDCSGLVANVYRSSYNRMLSGSAQDMFKNVEPLKKSDLLEGDLVFFKIKGNKISHVGIYIGQNRFVHSSVHSGVTLSDLDEPYYKKHFFKGGRVKN